MPDCFDAILDRYLLSAHEFERVLRTVRPGQWHDPTPCREWDVRQLVNHVTRGNLNYAALAGGGSAAGFLRLRDADALEPDPLPAYRNSVQTCLGAFARPGALERILDYPLGKVTGRQALAVRTTDTAIHTWDLARAIETDDRLPGDLVDWIDGCLDRIYAGLPETPVAAETTHRFFGAPQGPAGASKQDELLWRMGRTSTRSAS